MPDPPPVGRINVELAPDRTGLARYRTNLALDRTTLAWVRTTLSMTTFGFGTVSFFRTLREKSPTSLNVQIHEDAIRFGVALIVISIVVSVLVAFAHVSSLRRLQRDETPDVPTWSMTVTLSLFLALVGLVALWLLFDRP